MTLQSSQVSWPQPEPSKLQQEQDCEAYISTEHPGMLEIRAQSLLLAMGPQDRACGMQMVNA